jgi:hypothetical protein
MSYAKTPVNFILMIIGVFAFALLIIAPEIGRASDMVRPADAAALKEYSSQMHEEYSYRMRVDQDGAKWAKELMLLYKWSLKYPSNLRAMPDTPESKAALSLRIQSELAWMMVTGHGLLATFDFSHADQTLLGSTSRLVSALERSPNFWTEVRTQCIEIDELRRKASSSPTRDLNIEGCAARLKRDIAISQVVASNVSLFVGGGIVLGVGKKLFQKYAAKWFAVRVLPLIPAFAKTRWALAGLTAAIVVVPAGFILA